MRVIVIGANGQLGTDLVKLLSGPGSGVDLVPLTHKDIEICDHTGARETLTRLKPDVVINTAAYHRVDECEDYPEKAFQVNAIAVRNLALVCLDLDAVLVHMSTDYVFGGDQNRRTPHTEDDPPWPLNVYGVSKLAGESFVRNLCPKHFVVRSSGLYSVAGSSGKGGNFVELMLRLAGEGRDIKVVDCQVLTPTYTVDLAWKIKELIQADHFGLYHITNNGWRSWYQFAAKIFQLSGVEANWQRTDTHEFGAAAPRSRYSVLSNASLQKIGMDDLGTWEAALRAYLQEKSR